MKPKQLTPQEIRQIRLNQPSTCLEEVIAQFEKNRQARLSAETATKSEDNSTSSKKNTLPYFIAPVSAID